MSECRCSVGPDGRVSIRGFCPIHVEPLIPAFEVFCDAWEAKHPDEEPVYPHLFGQFLANLSGGSVIGRAEVTGDIVLAIPEDDEAHQ